MLTKRDLARKTIHISSVLTILYHMFVGHKFVVYSWILIAIIYSVSEYFRLRRVNIPITTDIINYCAYPEEKRSFIVAPLYFCLSIIILLAFFDPTSAYVGIIALSLGDGFSTILGKEFGRRKLPYARKKTLEGSFTCFLVTLLGSLFFVKPLVAFLVSLAAAFVESISGKLDNLTVPFATSTVVWLLLKI
jgi:dolichol kinase